MSDKSIADMKAELKANGYRFFAWGSSEEVHAPDGWHLETTYHYGDASEWWSQFEDAKQRLIKVAYAHLQERKELEALRAYALKAKHNLAYSDNLQAEASNLIDQYNIQLAESEGE